MIEVTIGGASIPSRAVAECGIARGRRTELDTTDTGTADIEVNVVDPAFRDLDVDLNNLESQEATIALRNPVTDSSVTIYTGYVDDINFTVERSRVKTTANISLVDGLDKLRRVELYPSDDPNPPFGYAVPVGYSGQIFYEDAGQVQLRIEKALLEAGWPLDRQEIFSGNVSLQEMLYSPRTNILEVIQDCAEAEFPSGLANFFMDKFGTARFKGRLARFHADLPEYDVETFQAGVGSASRAAVSDLVYNRGRSRIINAALCTPRGIDEHRIKDQVVVDQSSIDAHGLHSWSAEELLTDVGFLGTPNRTPKQETKLFARWYVENYKNPRERVDKLSFVTKHPDDYRASVLWDLLCNVDISHLIDLAISGPGFSFAEDFFVEGITYRIRPMTGDFAEVHLDLDCSPRAYYDFNPFQ